MRVLLCAIALLTTMIGSMLLVNVARSAGGFAADFETWAYGQTLGRFYETEVDPPKPVHKVYPSFTAAPRLDHFRSPEFKTSKAMLELKFSRNICGSDTSKLCISNYDRRTDLYYVDIHSTNSYERRVCKKDFRLDTVGEEKASIVCVVTTDEYRLRAWPRCNQDRGNIECDFNPTRDEIKSTEQGR